MYPPFDQKPIIIYPEGMAEETRPKNGEVFELDELQRIVGGYIEVVQVGVYADGCITALEMYVNEEGKLKNLPVNNLATMLYQNIRATEDVIVGTVLVSPQRFFKRDE